MSIKLPDWLYSKKKDNTEPKSEPFIQKDEVPNSPGIIRISNMNVPACLILTYANDPDGEEESTVEFVNTSIIPSIILAAMHGKRRLVGFAVYGEMSRCDDVENAEYELHNYTIPDDILTAMNSEEGGVKINSRGFSVKDAEKK